ncbi:pullulanase [Paenibacillus sp. HN-1]|uniref:DUF6509 family protein n=1 Tax=Paenibacillus TaxID=44249 RepID=UPI001CA8B075|nr:MULTISPECIES: DUF6509 family protein [Paenibacillus]MBY9077873.1 pullulanase [Paenibacillus sp. CGMCC 1.18879]MBY9088171.1 pullulanase [Paenibacillus sinensis]
MLAISEYSVDKIRDPFGIISGTRYEFMIKLDVPEDDELYSENGVSVRAVVKKEGGTVSVVTYDVMETTTQKLMDFDLEDDEEEELAAFCREHLPEE